MMFTAFNKIMHCAVLPESDNKSSLSSASASIIAPFMFLTHWIINHSVTVFSFSALVICIGTNFISGFNFVAGIFRKDPEQSASSITMVSFCQEIVAFLPCSLDTQYLTAFWALTVSQILSTECSCEVDIGVSGVIRFWIWRNVSLIDEPQFVFLPWHRKRQSENIVAKLREMHEFCMWLILALSHVVGKYFLDLSPKYTHTPQFLRPLKNGMWLLWVTQLTDWGPLFWILWYILHVIIIIISHYH